jgi:hypothetical protein
VDHRLSGGCGAHVAIRGEAEHLPYRPCRGPDCSASDVPVSGPIPSPAPRAQDQSALPHQADPLEIPSPTERGDTCTGLPLVGHAPAIFHPPRGR